MYHAESAEPECVTCDYHSANVEIINKLIFTSTIFRLKDIESAVMVGTTSCFRRKSLEILLL